MGDTGSHAYRTGNISNDRIHLVWTRVNGNAKYLYYSRCNDLDNYNQATSWSLRAFVLSSLKEIRFWTVRTDTLTAHKITAVKKKRMILNLNGANEEAVEVELRLGGLLSVFWKSNYWFRRTDGVFLRFEGPSGPPGAPDVIVEYQGPAPPCEMSALGTPSGIPLNHSESRQQMISDMSILHLK